MSKHEIVEQRVLEFLKESPVHPQHVVVANGQAKKRGAKPR